MKPILILRDIRFKFMLSFNENYLVLDYLEQNPELICFELLAFNKCALHIIEKNIDKIKKYWNNFLTNSNKKTLDIIKKYDNIINHYYLSQNENPEIIKLLYKYKDKNEFNWAFLSSSSNEIKLLEENIDCIYWSNLSMNPNALILLEKYPHKIDWVFLSKNVNALHILDKNIDKIYWNSLSENPNAIYLLEKNIDKISWNNLCKNTNGIKLIEDNLDEIKNNLNLCFLSNNPNGIKIIDILINKYNYNIKDFENIGSNENAVHLMFNYDYITMRKNNASFFEELVSKVFNPERLLKLCETYNLSFDEINDCY